MSFAAGFAQGFANTFVGRLEDRKERIQDLVDQGISSAKAVAPRYMQAQAEYKNILEIGDSLKNTYAVSDEEFVALAQGTDVAQLYKTIQQENQQRVAAGRSPISKQDFINIVDMPESVLPEGTTREQALAQIMGLQGQALAKEDDPKSEGARNRSGGIGLSEFLGYNPKLSAEKQLEAMKIMGYDVSDLEYFQSTGGLKQKVVQGVTRTRDVMFDDIDYDKGSYDGTQRKFNSMFATRLAGADISNPEVFSTTTGIAGDDKQTMRDNALEASMAMAKLELSIVNSGVGLGLIGPAARRNMLEGIFSQVDSGSAGVAELETLMKNIENGTATDTIVSIFNEKGRFTAEDYQSIISGTVAEEVENALGSIRPKSRPPVIDPNTVLTTILEDNDNPLVVEDNTTDDSEIETLEDQIATEEDPLVKKLLQNELNNMLQKNNSEQDEVRYPNATPPEGSPADQERKAASSFVMDNSQSILDELANQGLTGESSKEEVKLALTAFYRDNQDGPIGEYIATAPIQDINRIADVFKLTLENLDKE